MSKTLTELSAEFEATYLLSELIASPKIESIEKGN